MSVSVVHHFFNLRRTGLVLLLAKDLGVVTVLPQQPAAVLSEHHQEEQQTEQGPEQVLHCGPGSLWIWLDHFAQGYRKRTEQFQSRSLHLLTTRSKKFLLGLAVFQTSHLMTMTTSYPRLLIVWLKLSHYGVVYSGGHFSLPRSRSRWNDGQSGPCSQNVVPLG